jgi:hypothetical protein
MQPSLPRSVPVCDRPRWGGLPPPWYRSGERAGNVAAHRAGEPWRLVLLGIAAAPFEVPDGIRPTSLLAALLRHHYPGADVEEFPTAQGEGVGIRRSGELPLPGRVPDAEPLTIDTGISQGLVPFPEAGLLGTVTGFCFGPDDIDVATVFTATIAHRMTVVRRQLCASGVGCLCHYFGELIPGHVVLFPGVSIHVPCLWALLGDGGYWFGGHGCAAGGVP